LLIGPAMERVHARRWLGVAVLSLVLAGMLSVALVVGRAPGLCELFTDPLFFRRGLVVHVDLALVVWFNAFLAALVFLVPSRRPVGVVARLGSTVAVVGIVLFVLAAGMPGAAPVLSNYVPAIDHPLFAVGLLAFGAGVLMALLDRRLLPGAEAGPGFFPVPASARTGVRAAALAVVLAALTFGASMLVVSRALPADTYYELVAWGGGHVLQLAGTAGMIAAWLILLSRVLGEDPVDRRLAAWLFAALLAPVLAAPALALAGPEHNGAHTAFTTIMRWGIFPVVLTFLGLCLRAVWRARRARRLPLRHPALVAFGASAALALTGFVLGALIRGANTMVPAHYHASIGAVTVAYMAVTYPLLERVGLPLPAGRTGRLIAWQPAVFAAGQLVFAVGFAIAGAGGMGRKTYATDQHVEGLSHTLGLAVMGLGGLIAVTAGVLFLWVVVRAWLGRRSDARGGLRWGIASILSRS